MKVALIGEGTYPHQFGGVSVWCDQLVRGLPQYDFTVVPLVATGNESIRWELPANVKSVVTIPLWGRPPSVPLRSRLSRDRNDSMLPELIDLLLSPPAEAQDRFTSVMHELFAYAQAGNLRTALASETAVRLLSDAWRQRWPEILPKTTKAGSMFGAAEDAEDGPHDQAGALSDLPTLGDAVTAMQLLEHALRSFSHPPVQADVAHTVTNGLGALPALAARWRYGTPMIVTEHGVYLREQYMHLRRPQFGWHSLTPTERTVAGLVAEGLSNPQIGDRLYVSRRTVQAHLAHIFAKLDLTSRVQLAAEVIRRTAIH